MAETWTTIVSTETDPKAPLKSSLVKRMVANPIAAMQGAAGAPYNQACWHPYDGEIEGDGADGVIYDFSVDGVVASVTTPDFEENYDYCVLFEEVSHNNGTVTGFRLDLNGSVSGYITGASTPTVNNSALSSGYMLITNPYSLSNSHGMYLCISETAGIASAGTSVMQRGATKERILNGRIRSTSGSIDAGKLYMMKRRCFFGF